MGIFDTARINVAKWISPKGPDLAKEVSKSQAMASSNNGRPMRHGKGYDKYRRIRHDPTIALARVATVAPILASGWTVTADEDAPNGAKELIEDTFYPIRPSLLEHVLFYGYVDYGWSGFEKVWENRNGLFTIKKFKPLLHDISEIVVDKETGNFLGYKQKGGNDIVEIRLPKALHYVFRMEGQNWYGESLYENVMREIEAYWATESNAAKYDSKVAGAIRILHYKAGDATVDGSEDEASKHASLILDALQGSGDLAIPHTEGDPINGQDPWRFEYVESSGSSQGGFVQRAEYLDKLKVRGMLQPERAILEGQHGTKADAEAHGDIPLTMAELTHNDVTRNTNWHAVNPILVANWGENAANKVRLEADPISDNKRGTFEKLLQAMMSNPTTMLEVFTRLDIPAIIDTLGVPRNEGDVLPMRNPVSTMDGGAAFAENIEAFSERLRAGAANA